MTHVNRLNCVATSALQNEFELVTVRLNHHCAVMVVRYGQGIFQANPVYPGLAMIIAALRIANDEVVWFKLDSVVY